MSNGKTFPLKSNSSVPSFSLTGQWIRYKSTYSNPSLLFKSMHTKCQKKKIIKSHERTPEKKGNINFLHGP
ncbi:hypothetical protein BT93_H0378 [Corymbia citriodora subsp. variegata]|nr:hypothetical protein BT93_H0378 [Corymbia citriodora subsp. variegata]